MAEDLDLGPHILDALTGADSIALELQEWNGVPSIHTKRPAPKDAKYPFIIINAEVAIGDADGLKSARPIVRADVTVYGRKPRDHRTVQKLGFRIRELFHREKWAITPDGYDVIDIECQGPVPGPTDDDTTVARVVGLIIRLRRKT